MRAHPVAYGKARVSAASQLRATITSTLTYMPDHSRLFYCKQAIDRILDLTDKFAPAAM